MDNKVIVHVAEIEVTPDTGMGRIAWYWKQALEERGYTFVHVGPKRTGKVRHRGLFPYAARRAADGLGLKPSLYLVHEPACGPFTGRGVPTALFSHGIERRKWELGLAGKLGTTQKLDRRTKALFPLWRLRTGEIGLRRADRLLLSNHEDVAFAQSRYGRKPEQITVFDNGVSPLPLDQTQQPDGDFTVLFLGQWQERKGVRTLVEATEKAVANGLRLKWLLAGTSLDEKAVLDFWPKHLHPLVEVVPRFDPSAEKDFFARANLFVLPSFFEGQPLALLQAMEAGRCCITTDCCGQRDLIQNGVNGLLHAPGDAEGLARLIEKCANDAALRLTMGANAKASVDGRGWEKVSQGVADQIDRLLAAKTA